MVIKVKIEDTPNPASKKFNFGRTLQSNSQSYRSSQETSTSPLASKIFGFPWTQEIFLGPDFITVTKQNWVDWEILAEPLKNLIQEHIERGEPLWIDPPQKKDLTSEENENLKKDPLFIKIQSFIQSEVRPLVALDGGDIDLVSIQDGIVTVRLLGACSGCPSSSMTLKQGVEARMKKAFPEVQEVRSL